MEGRSTLSLATGAIAALLVAVGCQRPPGPPQFGTVSQPYAAALLGQYHIVGESVHGKPIMARVFGQGRDVVLVLGGIHGDEPAGTVLVRRLAKHLERNLDVANGRTIILVPAANPDGLATGSRYNARGVDLNRNFQAANRKNNRTSGPRALSEPETRAIKEILREHAPERIVSIHQPLACIDYDGPAWPVAARMAQYCDLPIRKLGAKPGSLGSYAGVTLGIPTITFELRAADSQLDEQALWRKYGKALLAAVMYPKPPPP